MTPHFVQLPHLFEKDATVFINFARQISSVQAFEGNIYFAPTLIFTENCSKEDPFTDLEEDDDELEENETVLYDE